MMNGWNTKPQQHQYYVIIRKGIIWNMRILLMMINDIDNSHPWISIYKKQRGFYSQINLDGRCILMRMKTTVLKKLRCVKPKIWNCLFKCLLKQKYGIQMFNALLTSETRGVIAYFEGYHCYKEEHHFIAVAHKPVK